MQHKSLYELHYIKLTVSNFKVGFSDLSKSSSAERGAIQAVIPPAARTQASDKPSEI